MIPVYQTKEGCIEGNCLAAAFASIIENDINSYPEIPNDLTWYDIIAEYLWSIGWAVEWVDCGPGRPYPPKGHCIMVYENKALGCDHACVGLDGVLVHNPSYSNNELVFKYFGIVYKIV